MITAYGFKWRLEKMNKWQKYKAAIYSQYNIYKNETDVLNYIAKLIYEKNCNEYYQIFDYSFAWDDSIKNNIFNYPEKTYDYLKDANIKIDLKKLTSKMVNTVLTN